VSTGLKDVKLDNNDITLDNNKTLKSSHDKTKYVHGHINISKASNKLCQREQGKQLYLLFIHIIAFLKKKNKK